MSYLFGVVYVSCNVCVVYVVFFGVYRGRVEALHWTGLNLRTMCHWESTLVRCVWCLWDLSTRSKNDGKSTHHVDQARVGTRARPLSRQTIALRNNAHTRHSFIGPIDLMPPHFMLRVSLQNTANCKPALDCKTKHVSVFYFWSALNTTPAPAIRCSSNGMWLIEPPEGNCCNWVQRSWVRQKTRKWGFWWCPPLQVTLRRPPLSFIAHLKNGKHHTHVGEGQPRSQHGVTFWFKFTTNYVLVCRYRGADVAVKTMLDPTPENLKDFEREILISSMVISSSLLLSYFFLGCFFVSHLCVCWWQIPLHPHCVKIIGVSRAPNASIVMVSEKNNNKYYSNTNTTPTNTMIIIITIL